MLCKAWEGPSAFEGYDKEVGRRGSVMIGRRDKGQDVQ